MMKKTGIFAEHKMKDSSDQYINLAMRQIYEHSTISISIHGF